MLGAATRIHLRGIASRRLLLLCEDLYFILVHKGGTGETGSLCNVRLHRNIKPVGDGLQFHATAYDMLPRIIFLASDLSPLSDYYVIFFGDDLVYYIKNVLPSDGVAVVTEAVLIATTERDQLPFAVAFADLATDPAADATGQYRYLLDTVNHGLIVSDGEYWVRVVDDSVVA